MVLLEKRGAGEVSRGELHHSKSTNGVRPWELLEARAEARKAKNWAESDRIRDEIAAAGWLVKDSKDGQSVSRKGATA